MSSRPSWRRRVDDIPVEELVARRRLEHERNQTVVLPEYSTGPPTAAFPGGAGAGAGGGLRGAARPLGEPREGNRQGAGDNRPAQKRGDKPGEILVAPVTDAAWTPLFVTAGAIVVDVGGPLSHGSIVAREYGIPGVLSVRLATRLIKTGQLITVDGDHGRVYLHPRRRRGPERDEPQAGHPAEARFLMESPQGPKRGLPIRRKVAALSTALALTRSLRKTGAPPARGRAPPPPSTEFHWNESYYFNFIDPENKSGAGPGWGFSPTRRATSGPSCFTRVEAVSSPSGAGAGRRQGGRFEMENLEYHCVEPLEKWRLRFERPDGRHRGLEEALGGEPRDPEAQPRLSWTSTSRGCLPVSISRTRTLRPWPR